VLEEYAKVGLTLAENKGAVMRALSSSFKKNEMKKVYSLIVRYGGMAVCRYGGMAVRRLRPLFLNRARGGSS
jgi:hypothetical protein